MLATRTPTTTRPFSSKARTSTSVRPFEPRGIDQRLVDEGRELLAEIRAAWEQLHHEHHHQPRVRVDKVGRSVGTAPAERTDGAEAVRAIPIHGLEAKAETEAGRRMQRPDLIRRHQRDGPWREN